MFITDMILKKNAPVFGAQGWEGKGIGSFFKIKSVIDIFFACLFFLTFKRGKRKASTFNLSPLLLIKIQRKRNETKQSKQTGKEKKKERNNFRFCLIICKQSVQRKHCSCTTIILLKYCPYDVKPYLIYQSTDHVIFARGHSSDFIRLISAIIFAERRNYIKNCGKFTLSFCLNVLQISFMSTSAPHPSKMFCEILFHY